MSQDRKSWKPQVILPEPWIPTPGHDKEQPKTITKTGRREDVLYLAGVGKVDEAEIMFVQLAPYEEQCEEATKTSFGSTIPGRPGFDRGSTREFLEHAMNSAGLRSDLVYHTGLIKWLLPKEVRDKPGRDALEWGRPVFEDEVKRIKPKIIVCLGKKVFDQLQPYKFKLGEIAGGWFDAEVAGHKCLLYPVDDPAKAMLNAELLERLALDIKEVRSGYEIAVGLKSGDREPVNERVIRNSVELRSWVNEMLVGNFRKFSVDGEWRGINHAKGQLRSIQFAWTRNDGVFIRFCAPSESGQPMPYEFDVDYKKAGDIMRPLFDDPETKLIGHQIAADIPWLYCVLGLPYIGKVEFDSLYAQQIANENQEGKLERMGMLRTDLGRWDLPLQIWKKTHKLTDEDGYGPVPDSILIPYGVRDVLAPFRMQEQLEAEIKAQGMKLWFYYKNKFLPFVTEGFATFTITGIPIDRPKLEELRKVYSWAYQWKYREFMVEMEKDAIRCIEEKLRATGKSDYEVDSVMTAVREDYDNQNYPSLEQTIKEGMGAEHAEMAVMLYEHLRDVRDFNFRSQPQLQRWVFGIKGFTPLRSTGNKEKGIPAMAWDKVLAFPPEKRKDCKPSCDKNALQVYAGKDKTISKLLSLNLIGNLTKGFLRPADVDPETGDTVKENGLFFWLSDEEDTSRINGQWSSTETGRPRSWNPNVYNLPAYVNKRVAEAVMEAAQAAAKLAKERNDPSILPDFMRDYVHEAPMSIRNASRAIGEWNAVERLGSRIDRAIKDQGDGKPVDLAQLAADREALVAEMERISGEAWCIVETDFQTAEVKCLAYISGDEAMIAAVTGVDTNFAMLKSDNEKQVRLSYTSLNPAPLHMQIPQFLNCYVSEQTSIKSLADKVDLKGRPQEEVAEEIFARMCAENPDKFYRVGEKSYVTCTKVSDTELLRDEYGVIVHPRRDLHWEIVEEAYGKIRELMTKKVERNSGKVANFSSAYGASAASLERKIEVDTGVKPEEGTGQKLLDALDRKYPVAQAFLRNIEKAPLAGPMQVFSGRIRHFVVHPEELEQLSGRQRESALSPLGREARNYPMQHTVAHIAAAANMKMTAEFRRLNLRAVNIALLYDSIVSMCPVRERYKVRELHYKYMRDETYEIHHGRELHMGCDVEFNLRWSGRPAKAVRKFLDNPGWCNDYPESAMAA